MIDHPKDQLDAAIDRVANRMVSIDAGDLTVDRIVARLPNRTRPWLTGLQWQFVGGALAMLVVAVYYAGGRSTDVRRSFNERSPIVQNERSPVVQNDRRTSVEPSSVERSSNDRRTIVERSSNDRAAADFDANFGLAPVHEPAEIVLRSIDIDTALAVPASSLAPIVLSDLPSVDDSPSRDQVRSM